VRFCTVVTRSYLAQARVLARSLSANHGGERLGVLVIDDLDATVDATHEPFEVVRPEDLALSREDLDVMAVIYDAKELATALKPWLLRAALEEEPAAVHLDPDMEVHAPLDDLLELSARHGVLLTPQVLEPVPLDGRSPTEADLQETGIYNGGVVGVGRSGHAFLDWFAERLRRDCVADRGEGLFVDQRPIDFVPVFFDHGVLRDPGCNVANWNVHERDVTEADGRFFARGQPLRIFHFSGFDPERPHLLTAYRYRSRGPLRVTTADNPALRRLCAAYAERLLANGYRECTSIPYGRSSVAGVPLTPQLRRLYRALLRSAELGRGPWPPAPRDPHFGRWLERAARGDGIPAFDRALVLSARVPDSASAHRGVASARRLLGRFVRPWSGRRHELAQAVLVAVDDLEASSERALREVETKVALLETDSADRPS
jgi:hypothetical protein